MTISVGVIFHERLCRSASLLSASNNNNNFLCDNILENVA